MEETFTSIPYTDVYTAVDLRAKVKAFTTTHGIEPFILVSGHMETKQGERLYCDECYVGEAKGSWFTVCHPTGTFTMRVPEHEQITVTLTTNAEE